MKDDVFCYKCDKLFRVQYDEYYEANEEKVFTIIRCPYCKTLNSIYYSTLVKFHATEPTQEDLIELKSDVEDESYEGGKIE